MTNKDILNAMGNIDSKLIVDASPEHTRQTRNLVYRKWLRWGVAVACIVACFILFYSVTDFGLKGGQENKLPDNPIVGDVPEYSDNPEITISPVDEQAYYTAEELQQFFHARKNDFVVTSYYTEVYVPSADYLNVAPLLEGDEISIFEKVDLVKSLDEKEFTEFLDLWAAKLLEELGEESRPYEIEKNYLTSLGNYLEVSLNGNSQLRKHLIYAEQTREYHTVTVSTWAEILNPTHSISLGTLNVEVDQTKSDKEILKSLETVREKLFTIFGENFADMKIVRKYYGDTEHGVSWLRVYFYDEDAHFLNSLSETPVSDYICLSFDNFANYEGDIVSDTILQDVSISYRKNRDNAKESYVESKKLHMISLEEAEEMLAKGYVFGGHACPYCMQGQEAVAFDGYDKVGMTYITGIDDKGQKTESLPFYVFYKYIKDAENGNQVYAKTYVPAILVSECEEYFENQKEYHTLESLFTDKAE